MDLKNLRSYPVAFVILMSVLFWAGCGPKTAVKPWDSQFKSKIRLSFTDTDTDPKQVGGDVLLKLKGAPQPRGISQYVLYWGESASAAGKGKKIEEVSVDIKGDLLYTIPQNTKIPPTKNQHFLLFLQKADGSESYSGISTKVKDETQTAEQKAQAARAREAQRLAAAAEATAAAEAKVKAKAKAKAEAKAKAAAAAEATRLKEKRLAQERAEEARAAALAAIVVENVLFDFDRSTLRSSFKQKLRDSFEGVENLGEIKIVISGHADERGSNEYNLALGERRAFAVKRYLISLGLLEENISIISYGEEKPVDPRHTEAAWELNRRSETDMRN